MTDTTSSDDEDRPAGEDAGSPTAGPRPPRSSRGRSVAAGLVGVVAVLGLLGGVLGFWTLRTATDSDRFEDRVRSLLEDEEISDALARRVVTEVTDAIGLRQAIEAAVPEVLQPAIDLFGAGVRSRVEDRVAELIRTPEIADAIAAAAGRAHAVAVDVIEGDDAVEGVDVADGEVRVNLLPLTARALTAMQEVGLLREVAVPVFDRAGDPDAQRAELAAALGRDLPEDFGTPVVLHSDALDRAGGTVQLLRDVLVLAERAVWFLFVGGLLLAGVSIWLSSQRWRSASFIVAALFAFALAIRLVMARATDRLPNAVEQPGARATVRQIAEGLARSLNQTMIVWATLGLIALAVAAAVQFDLVGRVRGRGPERRG